ncbi:laminin subunit beta-3-like isoform X4 [Anguilla rostrata]|uniref:laminin subunit beta-3-like isoform X4 n=1 Tax=Anguilla rostrata TaxID=7938 RepID=UPI0030CCD93C
MKTWILFQIAALAALTAAQQDCSKGACYPPAGDLLLGRAKQLHASSTCGLLGSEVFCTPYGLTRMKCCPCDSQNPEGPNAHTIQEVLSTSAPHRWWQSRKGVSPVSLQLDLSNPFQLDTLVMKFKGPRPDALIIERSTDFGRTWTPALYMATDCRSTFPSISISMPQNLEHTYCYPLLPITGNHYLDQTIYFYPLRQFSDVSTPNSHKIEEVTDFTNLRVNLTQLGQVPHVPGRSPSRFYALKEMQVLGSCFCHGHANRCLPDHTTNQLPSTQVSPVCECQHNTAGVNCERCAELYNDLPWKHAEEGRPNACKRCECNNHAKRCRFDRKRYEASGRVSGGVCEGCMHNTAGPNCEQCAPNYYRNPRSAIDRTDTCLRCQCSAEGAEQGSQCDSTGACRCKANVEGPRCERCRKGYYSLNAANPLGCSRCQCSAEGAEQGGQCDSTGACLCKANVEGPRCERCRKGYYGLNAANPLGCSKCSCSVDGSSSDDACDPLTGQCSCPPNVQGLACDRCAPGFWKLSPTRGCERCSCDPTNSLSKTCDQLTGQCQCRFGFGGRTCEECPDNTYGDPDTTCRRCKCDLTGTEPGGCDKKTGQCKCLPGVTGERCDACARGRCDRYPDCPACPSCFFTLDRQLKDFTLSLRRLVSQAPTLPETTPTDLTPRIRALEDTLSKIRDTLPLPAPSDSRVDKLLADLRRLREKAGQLDPELFPTDEVPALAKQLDDLRAELAGLNLDYNSKKDALKNVVNASLGDAFATIKKAYDESTDALKNAEGTQPVVEKSETTRKDATDLEGTVQPTNTADLKNLDDQLASRPNLTPAAKQVCGSTRSTPCTPAQCDGELCPEPGTVSCVEGKTCVGALPLGEKALKDTEEVKNRLQQLNKKIQEAADKIQAAEDSANDVRQSTDDLSNQIKQARNGLDDELGDIKKFVKNLKDFLSDPLLDPTAIQTVSEEILATKLPLSLAALKRKIQEIEKLAAGLPDSSKLLASTTPQLDLARKLLGEAQDARDTALGVKGKVDKLLGDLGSAEELLEDVDGKIQDTLDVLDTVTANIAEAKKKLDPATTLLDEVTGLTGTMLPELDKLKELVQNETENAQKAQVDAEAAKQEADDATKDLQALEDQLELLRQKAKEADGKGEVASGAGERLKKLQEESGTLIQDTMDMMRNLTGAEESLAEATNQLLKKAQNLTGLDKRLQKLLDEIRAKADYMSSCRG